MLTSSHNRVKNWSTSITFLRKTFWKASAVVSISLAIPSSSSILSRISSSILLTTVAFLNKQSLMERIHFQGKSQALVMSYTVFHSFLRCSLCSALTHFFPTTFFLTILLLIIWLSHYSARFDQMLRNWKTLFEFLSVLQIFAAQGTMELKILGPSNSFEKNFVAPPINFSFSFKT